MFQYDINKLLQGEFVNECCNFYDYFCKTETLQKRALKLLPKIKFLIEQEIINPKTTYVWFKNNCPCVGRLYDDFRFSTKDTKIYLGGFAPSLGYSLQEGHADGWYYLEGEFYDTMGEFKNWKELKNYIKNDSNFKALLKKAFWVD